MGNVCSCLQRLILSVSKRAACSNPWYFWCPDSVCVSHLRVLIHGPWRNLWLVLNTMTSAEFSSRNVKMLIWCLPFAFLYASAFLPVAEYPLLPSGSCLWWRLLSSAVSHQVWSSCSVDESHVAWSSGPDVKLSVVRERLQWTSCQTLSQELDPHQRTPIPTRN